ncbi:MAG: Gx transporter family protein [Coriobacteriia bacterium]|nr:Gx transporter family protein [Coriobacteriia bacterium]MBN2823495.1 Gx transporter family protein [Coriobacteriia bacterium]
MPLSAEVSLPLARSVDYGARRVAYSGVLLVGAVVLGLAESWLLSFSPVPWLRLGLANVAVLVALAYVGPRSAFAVTSLKVVVVGLATGALFGPATLLAMSGSVCALVAMLLVRAAGSRFSVIGWSIAGAAAHVVGQFLGAVAVTGSDGVLSLMPLSILASIFLGAATGFVAWALLSRLRLAV